MSQSTYLFEKPVRGLKSADVPALRQTHGWNELPRAKRAVWPVVLFRQFTSVLVVILIFAAAIAVAFGEHVDALAIGLVVLLNGVLGFVQEWRAENALDALRSVLAPSARVIRDEQEQVIDARELVPGDLVVLDAGDRVPADLMLTNAVQLELDESALTGESVPVEKSVDAVQNGTAPQLFMGTSVVAGRGEGVVSAIGAASEFGHIAMLTGSVRDATTPLQRRLARLAQQLGAVAVLLGLGVAVLGYLEGRLPIEMFMTGLSLAVAIVPEGLPLVVTVTLALGVSAMVHHKALARQLQAVETLGSASVICTDKTGTLTENKMTAQRIWMADASYDVTGTGYDPAGHISCNGQRVRAKDDPALAELLATAITCNHAQLRRIATGWEMIGEPTEGALVTLAYKGWAALPNPAARVSETPFSSDRKRMSVVVHDGNACLLHAKGAPEQILAASTLLRRTSGTEPLTDQMRHEIITAYHAQAAEGLRVIALAGRPVSGSDHAEQDLIFLGLVGLIDPPRPEVKQAIALTHSAGVKVVMITGDSPVTAKAIAARLGLPVDLVLTGPELEATPDADLPEILARDVLFARTSPSHKMRIVQALQAHGRIVAMTGDGVNDAPALKQADIGVSMGIRGTDVARDASDLVLLDDNFASIVAAIGEGRRQFENIRKFVRYLMASNAGEVVALTANILIGGPLVFFATQILWMNLVTDGVTAVALGLEKAEAGQMRQPPRPPDEAVLGRSGLWMILGFGIYTGSASLGTFYWLLPMGEDIARTAAFTAMAVFEKLSVFAFRSFREPCSRIGWTSNPLLLLALGAMLVAQLAAVYWPPLQTLLHTVPLGLNHWSMIALLALPIIFVPETVKTLLAR